MTIFYLNAIENVSSLIKSPVCIFIFGYCIIRLQNKNSEYSLR